MSRLSDTLAARRLTIVLALAAFAALGLLGPSVASASAPTVVSFTVDDGSAGQYLLRGPLAAHGMHATFFINTNTIGSGGTGSSARMDWQQIQDLAVDGNEIGGHTLDHPDLTTLSSAEAQRQICDDRSALLSRGYPARSFAYPYGATNLSIETLVQLCGYSTARSYQPSGTGVESLPPFDAYNTRMVRSLDSFTTLLDLQNDVTQVENGSGGWLQFVVHRVCDGCDVSDAVQVSTLDQFMSWLQPRAASGTVVKTVDQAHTDGTGSPGPDTTPPTSQISCNDGSCASWFAAPVTVKLTATDARSGVAAIRYTTDGSDPTSSSPLYTSPFTVAVTTTVKFRAWDGAGNVETVKSQDVRIDTTAPQAAISCNDAPCQSTAYTSPVTVRLSATDADAGVAAIRYTTDGSDPTSTSPLYSSSFDVGQTTTIKFRAWDAAGNASVIGPQVVNVQSTTPDKTVVTLGFDDDAATQWQVRDVLRNHSMHATFFVNSGTVGTDGTGSAARMTWAQVHELYADGNEIGGHTVDHADLTTLSAAAAQQEVCDDRQTLLSHGFNVRNFAYPYGAYNPGVQAIVRDCGYDSGRAFTASLGTESLPPVDRYGTRIVASVDSTTTLADMQSFVTNAEQVGGGWVQFVFHRVCGPGCDVQDAVNLSTLTTFMDWLQPRSAAGTRVATVMEALGNSGTPPGPDTTAPASTVRCNDAPCGAYINSATTISLQASDAGSGVAAIRYTTDGSTPTATSTIYTGRFTVSASTTIKFRAWDLAGNVEDVNTQTLTLDTTAPTSSITCNGAPCSGFYSPPVTVALASTDAVSGIDVVRYTTDGTVPTTASPVYSGPFSVATTTTVRYRAWDKAGNVEATRTQSVQIDTSAPATTIRCNATTCSTGWYNADVSVSLTATDSGSGVAAIRYTLDGTAPMPSSPLFSSPFTVSSSATVSYRAWDNVGNVEAVKTRLIRVDKTAPAVAITSPASGARVTGTVAIQATATDADSGVANVAFRVGSTTLSTDTTAPYSANWSATSGTYTLTAVATDRAGNATTSAPITVTRP